MGKSAPTPPDYKGAAEATAASNKEATTAQTWANRPTINTPWGSQSWSTGSTVDPSTGQQVTTWNSDISLSPAQQASLDSQQAIQQGRSDAAQGLLGQATDAFKTPMAWGDLPARPDQVEAFSFGGAVPELGGVQKSLSPTKNSIQTVDPFSFGKVQTELGDTGPVQRQLNGSSGDYRERAQDAVWNLQKPMFDERRAATETQLANMGLARGSEAWNREMRTLGDAEARAQLAAISEGRNEAQMQFGQDLQAGQFANSGQAQEFGQELTRGQFANSGQAQEFGQFAAATGINNNAQGQEFGQNVTGANFGNNALQQEYEAAMRSMSAGDDRLMKEFAAKIQAGNYNANTRTSAIGEETLRRGQTLNELNALLTGQQVNMPTMPGFSTAQRSAGTDYSGAAESQYGAAINDANFRQGQINNLMNLGGSLATAFRFSDRRLKKNIRTLGILSTGVPVVYYEYLGQSAGHVGVIAQDLLAVQPDAVAVHPSGFMMVNYAKVRL